MGSRFDPNVLFRIPMVYPDGEGFHISPDGRGVAFAWNRTGQWQVYLMGLDDKHPKQLTTGTESSISPRFSPDGKRIAYAQDYQGDEKFDILVRDIDSDRSENITPDTEDAIYPFIRWSPDGSKIAFASNRGGKYSVYSMPSEGGEFSLLCDHRYADGDPCWSPDGRRLMLASMTEGQDVGVFIVPASGGEPTQLGGEKGPIDASMPDWSPGSKRIVFASSSRGMSDIGIYDLSERNVEWLTDSKYECYDPCWSPDGLNVAYRENRNRDSVIVVHGLHGEKRVFQVEPGLHTQLTFTPDSKCLMFTFSGPRRPADLWILDIKDGKFRQLTDSLPPSIDPNAFVVPSAVQYQSAGGRAIPALLYKPSTQTKNAPAVVYIHGGPSAQHDNDWYPSVQDLVGRGFVVLAPNYRGSTGYGKEFREANRFVMGTDDLADVIGAAVFLKSEGLADRGRIAVTGISYGGYLTMCALTRHPSLWAAGSALFPFLNWFTEFENEREDLQYWDRENMGDPVRNADRFREASPLFFMDGVQAAVQIVAGANDPRCPMSESVQARDALRKLGKPVDFLAYNDEGHGFRNTENRVDAMKKRASFLEKHLGIS